ncbi:MAG: hypothetical protein IJ379_03025 [Lachnospiraceae bacterium]|nr:hypothetical protein [Lachnospiraceae bacterium]
MFTIKEFIGDMSNIDEAKLVEISDKLWKLGSLEEIREAVSPELFYLHVGMNMIGNWKGEGWWGVICEHADLIPYIPATLEQLNLPKLKAAFENVVSLFPEHTVFKADDAAYYDICNFLQSFSIKVQDERLKDITSEKRRAMVKQMRSSLNALEDLTEPLWGEQAECGGWKCVVDYISDKIEETQ